MKNDRAIEFLFLICLNANFGQIKHNYRKIYIYYFV